MQKKKVISLPVFILSVLLTCCFLLGILGDTVAHADGYVAYRIFGRGEISADIYDDTYYLEAWNSVLGSFFKGWIAVDGSGDVIVFTTEAELDSVQWTGWGSDAVATAVFAKSNESLVEKLLFSADDIEVEYSDLAAWKEEGSYEAKILNLSEPKYIDVTNGSSIPAPSASIVGGDPVLALGKQQINVDIQHEGGTVSISFNMTVTDKTPPEITAKNDSVRFYPANSVPADDELISLFGLEARDDVDGIITEFTIDTSLIEPMRAGSYPVKVKSVDNSGNVSESTITFVVIDVVPPVLIVGSNPAEIFPASAMLSTKEFANIFEIKAEDETDGVLTDFVFDTSNVNIAKPGTYSMKVAVQDKSGNETEVELTLIVLDNIPPVITAKNSFLRTVLGDGMPSEAELTAMYELSAEDETDGVLTNLIFDTSKVDTTWHGKYYITVTVRDKAGNVGEKQLVFSIIDLKKGVSETYYIEPPEKENPVKRPANTKKVPQITEDDLNIDEYINDNPQTGRAPNKVYNKTNFLQEGQKCF